MHSKCTTSQGTVDHPLQPKLHYTNSTKLKKRQGEEGEEGGEGGGGGRRERILPHNQVKSLWSTHDVTNRGSYACGRVRVARYSCQSVYNVAPRRKHAIGSTLQLLANGGHLKQR